MPSTRARTQKSGEALTTTPNPDRLLPSRRVLTSRAALKANQQPKEGTAESNTDDFVEVEKNKQPVFTVFKAENKLEEGICMVRSLGDDKYEIVNLQSVPRDDMTSEETGEIIKAVPKRRMMLDLSKEQWEEVMLKTQLAVKSADCQLFRFRKLPIELRYKVYDLIMLSSKTLHRAGIPDENLGLAFRSTCRQIHEETRPFFYRNNFRVSDNPSKEIGDSFSKHLREITFEWWGLKIKDPATLRFFAECPNLKVLHIQVTRYLVGAKQPEHRRNFEYQDNDSLKPFNKCSGFDNLVELRGLEKVTVSLHQNHKTAEFTDALLANLEAFLMSVLTKTTRRKPIEKRQTKEKMPKISKREVASLSK